MQEKLKNVWRIDSTLIITFQVTEENEADQTALEENYPSIGDPKEIGQAHNMFFHESSKKNLQIFLDFHYGNRGCGVFKGGIQNYKEFCIKNNIPKGNF